MSEMASSHGDPAVSIVMSVHNDEATVARALESCLAQSLEDVEVICVDGGSTDATCEVVEQFAARDSRVRVPGRPADQSPFDARRDGIMEATAPFALFLNGNDELLKDAARLAVESSREQCADVVGFGVEKIIAGKVDSSNRHKVLRPQYAELFDDEVFSGMFPVGEIVDGHLWGCLWTVGLLRGAYDKFPRNLPLERSNDLAISMLALARARKYTSTLDCLYRHYELPPRGIQPVDGLCEFSSCLSDLDAIDVAVENIHEFARDLDSSEELRRSCDSVRLSVIQEILHCAVRVEDESDQATCLEMLCEKVGSADVVRATAAFFRDGLQFISQHHKSLGVPPAREPRTVMLFTWNLKSGGVQGVLVSQAKHLVDAGYRVVVAVWTPRGRVHTLPEGVELAVISGRWLGEKLDKLQEICKEYAVDYAIDHSILYNDEWPYLALTAETLGVRTIGWIHSFALRPMLDFNHRTAYLTRYLPLLDKVVTLSSTDVAFWRSQGIDQVVYLPNPPSPWLLDRPLAGRPRELSRGAVRLVWWGRIQQHTKQVRELVDIAAALRQLGVEFRLTIIGPDSDDLTAEDLRDEAVKRGVSDAVVLTGPLHGEELLTELEQSDFCVFTSAIEGYLLTLVEGQALGLPVAMYELPWLAVVEGNDGIITSGQRDSRGLAQKIAALSRDPVAYRQRSRASLEAAARALQHDFTELYSQLLTGKLPLKYSPDRTLEMADLLMDRAVAFHEQNVLRLAHGAGESGAGPGAGAGAQSEAEVRRLKSEVLDAKRKLRAERAKSQRRVEALRDDTTRDNRNLRALRTWIKGHPRIHRLARRVKRATR